MGARVALIGAAAAIFSAAAIAQMPDNSGDKAPPACEGELFVFHAGLVGHVAKVTLCSKKDATPEDLVKLFESAATELSRNTRMAAEKRDDLVAQMRARAADVRAGKPVAATASLGPALPDASLAPLRPSAPADRPPEYAALPPLPPPPDPATATTAAASASAPVLTRPLLTIECMNQTDLAGAAPCDSLDRETIIEVRVSVAVPAGTALRFLRRGDLRAEVDLAQRRSAQFVLPRDVCAGVVESKVEIQVVRRAKASDAGQVVDSMGPYFLRC